MKAGVGRRGPYVVHERRYVSLEAPDSVLDINLERALEVIAEVPESGEGRQSTVLRELGEHPDGGPVQVLEGRYGPYVKHGKVNATIPKDSSPEEITMEQAVELLAKKKSGKKSTRGRKTKK